MAKTLDQRLAAANLIKSETIPNANTAPRVGGAMEDMNNAWNEETGEINVTTAFPPVSGYHTAETARNVVLESYRRKGRTISYQTAAGTWVKEQFRGDSTATWLTASNWYPILMSADQDVYNVTNKVPLAAGEYYNPTTARNAVPAQIRKLGLGLKYLSGYREIDTLTITGPAITDGNIIIFLNGVQNMASPVIIAGNTAIEIATKIRTLSWTGWTTGGTPGTAVVTFTRTAYDTVSAPTFSSTAGITATFTRTSTGQLPDWIHEEFTGPSTASWTTTTNWRKLANSTDIAAIETGLNKMELKSLNFISKLTEGFTYSHYIDLNGNPQAFPSTFYYTPLTDVKEGDVFFLRYEAGGLSNVISQYDINGVFSRWTTGIMNDGVVRDYIYTVPTGITKVRFCSSSPSATLFSKCATPYEASTLVSALSLDVENLKYYNKENVISSRVKILNESYFGALQNPAYSSLVMSLNRPSFNFKTLFWAKTGTSNCTTSSLAFFPYYFKEVTFTKMRTIYEDGKYDANILSNSMLVMSHLVRGDNSFGWYSINETNWIREIISGDGSVISLENAKYIRYEKDGLNNKIIRVYIEYIDGSDALYKTLTFQNEAFLVIGEFDFTSTTTVNTGIMCKNVYDFVVESDEIRTVDQNFDESLAFQNVLIPGGIGGVMKFNLLNYLTSSQFTGRKIKMDWYSCGDSITTGAGSTGNNNSYVTRLAQLVPFNSVTNRGISGSSVRAHFDTNGLVDRGRLITQINGIPQNTTGFVTIAMGVNDAGWGFTIGDVDTTLSRSVSDLNDGVSLVDGTETNATFCDALRYNIETIKSRAPEAIILFIIPIYRAGVDHVVENYRLAIRSMLKAYGIPYLDANLTLGFNRYNFTPGGMYTTDGLHPNDLGYDKYARYLLYEFSKYAI